MRLVSLVAVATLSLLVTAQDKNEEEVKLQWKDDDGLEITIIRPIEAEKCTIKSQKGDVVDQFYTLTDENGKEIGSNVGKEPYTFTLGGGLVILGMDRTMADMCIGEMRKVVIPGKLGFGDEGRARDNIGKNQTFYYTVHIPARSWREMEVEDGLVIEVTHKIEEDKCRRSESGDTIHQQYELHLGERRKVIIPYELGYGVEGKPPRIPAKSRLYFDITLEKLIKKDQL